MGVSLFEAVRLAFESLRASKLRSALTLVGVMLSTATLIAVMAIIHGMDVYVASSASTMGTDGFRVLRAAFGGYQDAKKFFEAQQKNPQLTQEEYEFVKTRLTLVGEAGISGTRLGTITYVSDAVPGVAIQGVTPNAAVMSNTQIDLGRFFSDIDERRHLSVVFIGSDLKDRFFPNVDPVGKTISIEGIPFEVIGTAQPKGSLFGQSQDNYVSIPVSTYFKIYGDRSGIGYNFQARNRDTLQQTVDEVRTLIRTHRHLAPQQDDNFSVISSDSLVTLWDMPDRSTLGFGNILKAQLLSFGMVVITGLLMVFSISISISLSAIQRYFAGWVPFKGGRVADIAISFVVTLVLFAIIYRLVPPEHMPWRHIAFGASTTAILFAVGKAAISAYIGTVGVGSLYGAAGSLFAFLIWLYYSSKRPAAWDLGHASSQVICIIQTKIWRATGKMVQPMPGLRSISPAQVGSPLIPPTAASAAST